MVHLIVRLVPGHVHVEYIIVVGHERQPLVVARQVETVLLLRLEMRVTGLVLGENQKTLYVPQFFGHGYLVLEDSVVSYKCGEVFYGEGDAGIMYNDPDMGIVWTFEKIGGIENLIISEKDKNLMSLKEYLIKVKA